MLIGKANSLMVDLQSCKGEEGKTLVVRTAVWLFMTGSHMLVALILLLVSSHYQHPMYPSKLDL